MNNAYIENGFEIVDLYEAEGTASIFKLLNSGVTNFKILFDKYANKKLLGLEETQDEKNISNIYPIIPLAYNILGYEWV